MISTALQKGIVPRAEVDSVDKALEYMDMGVRHFSIGNDMRILYNWYKQNGESLKEELRKMEKIASTIK